MKSIFAALFLLFAVSVAFAADQPSISGKWQVHLSISGTENDQTCTFTQKRTELTGTCNSEQTGTVDLTGKVDGKKITWSYQSEYNGTPLTVNYEGTLDGGKISGTVTVPEFGAEGEFTATQAK
jgi:type 1 fimbria pilin